MNGGIYLVILLPQFLYKTKREGMKKGCKEGESDAGWTHDAHNGKQYLGGMRLSAVMSTMFITLRPEGLVTHERLLRRQGLLRRQCLLKSLRQCLLR